MHPTGCFGLNLIEDLHGLDQSYHLPYRHLVAFAHERVGTRGRRAVEGAEQGRRNVGETVRGCAGTPNRVRNRIPTVYCLLSTVCSRR